MGKEQYKLIVDNLRKTMDESILSDIMDVKYTVMADYDVIQVYVKKGTKAKSMGLILINIEDYAKSMGYDVLVDFLRG